MSEQKKDNEWECMCKKFVYVGLRDERTRREGTCCQQGLFPLFACDLLFVEGWDQQSLVRLDFSNREAALVQGFDFSHGNTESGDTGRMQFYAISDSAGERKRVSVLQPCERVPSQISMFTISGNGEFFCDFVKILETSAE